MTTRRGPGALTTFLMLVPMLAVPVMALFGVPHFMPVVASPIPATQHDPFVGFRESRTGQSDAVLYPVSLRTVTEDVDLFQAYGAEAATTKSPTQGESDSRLNQIRNDWSDPLMTTRGTGSDRNRAAESTVDSTENGLEPGLVTIFDSRPIGRDSQPGPSARYEREGNLRTAPARVSAKRQSMTWRQASQILNDLGVRTYSLSPGLNRGDFRFVCLVSSSDDPRISRRFESNSTDPLIAVEEVIAQVKSWTQTKSR